MGSRASSFVLASLGRPTLGGWGPGGLVGYADGPLIDPADHLDGEASEPGHKKHGGRKAGTPNKASGEAREAARRLLDDVEYQRSLRKRLIRGEAPRLEVLIWELRYGKPPVEADEVPTGTDPTAGLVHPIEKLGEDPNRQPAPVVVDRHDGKDLSAASVRAARGEWREEVKIVGRQRRCSLLVFLLL